MPETSRCLPGQFSHINQQSSLCSSQFGLVSALRRLLGNQGPTGSIAGQTEGSDKRQERRAGNLQRRKLSANGNCRKVYAHLGYWGLGLG